MTKKIKSFTVDEDIYNRLVAMFKKYKAETSISMYLNNEIKYLLEYLEDLEKGMQERKHFSVPMSYVIDKMVEGAGRSGRISDEVDKYSDSPVSGLFEALEYWKDNYAADQQGIPYEYYMWLRSGAYELSKDKKFLIDKERGTKYIPLGPSEMIGVSDEDIISMKLDKDEGKKS